MTTETATVPTTVKFRETAVTAVVRDALGLTIWLRDVRKNAAGAFETVRVLAPVTLKFADCSEAVRAEAMGYGFEVALTRMAAIGKDTKTGKSATAEEKRDAIAGRADHFATGTESWTMASVGGGGLSADTRALIEALVAAFSLDPDVAETQVKEMGSAARDALRVDLEVKPYLDAVYAARAAKAGTDSAGLIERLKKLRA